MSRILAVLALTAVCCLPARADDLPAYQSVRTVAINELGRNAAVAALTGGAARIVYTRGGDVLWRDVDANGRGTSPKRVVLAAGTKVADQSIRAVALSTGRTAIAFAATPKGAATPAAHVGIIDGPSALVFALASSVDVNDAVAITALTNGNLVLAWRVAVGPRSHCLETQVVSPAGTEIGPRASAHSVVGCATPALARDGAGYSLFYGRGGSVIMHRFGPGSEERSSYQRIGPSVAGRLSNLVAVTLDDGTSGVFWAVRYPDRDAGGALIYPSGVGGRFVTADGKPARSVFFNDDAILRTDETRLTAAPADGGVMLAWAAIAHPIPQVSFSAELRGRLLRADGARGPVTTLTLDAGQPRTPWALAALDDGRIGLAYDRFHDERDPGAPFGLHYGQLQPAVDNPSPPPGNDAGQKLVGTRDRDTIRGLGGNDKLYGRAGDDRLDGGAGDDQLDGQQGVDVMVGGPGRDAYTVDTPYDRVVEAAGTDVNSVYATSDYALPETVHHLYADGYGARTVVGTDGDDYIHADSFTTALYGLAGNDILVGSSYAGPIVDGGPGADTMYGGHGAKIYVDDLGDRVPDGSGAEILTTVNFTLKVNIADLTGLGTKALRLTGNDTGNVITANDAGDVLRGMGGDDTLVGGKGGDRLEGGPGKDTLTGGPGRDVFVVSPDGADVVTDFEAAEDSIVTGTE